jgi:ABC-type spermidine/putrescine transport system permease subunit I
MAWRSGFSGILGWRGVEPGADDSGGRRQYAVDLGLGRFLVFVYIWLPFMILPVQAALERLPPSLLQASADLGARPRQTFRYVVLPLAIPALPPGRFLLSP